MLALATNKEFMAELVEHVKHQAAFLASSIGQPSRRPSAPRSRRSCPLRLHHELSAPGRAADLPREARGAGAAALVPLYGPLLWRLPFLIENADPRPLVGRGAGARDRIQTKLDGDLAKEGALRLSVGVVVRFLSDPTNHVEARGLAPPPPS